MKQRNDMKILIVSNGYPPLEAGGTELYTKYLAEQLARDHSVFIFVRSGGYGKNQLRERTYYDGTVKIREIINYCPEIHDFEDFYINEHIDKSFGAFLKEVNPDLIHIQHLIYLSVNLIKIIQKAGIPFVVTLHDFWFICPMIHMVTDKGDSCSGPKNIDKCLNECLKDYYCAIRLLKITKINTPHALPGMFIKFIKPLIFRVAKNKTMRTALVKRLDMMKGLLNSAEAITAPSNIVKNIYESYGVGRNRIIVTGLGVNSDFLATHHIKQISPKLRFGFIGYLNNNKGAHCLIKAFQDIGDDKAELRIYGSAGTGDIRYNEKIAALHKNNIFVFPGFQHNLIGSVLSMIDIIVIPSLCPETFSLVLHEALYTKTPAICSRTGVFPEVIRDGVNGILFKPGDAEELNRKIKLLIDNPEILEKIKSNIQPVKDIVHHSQEIEQIYSRLRRH
jgi:glycosyltransferase involved in cell wall biosynthesis